MRLGSCVRLGEDQLEMSVLVDMHITCLYGFILPSSLLAVYDAPTIINQTYQCQTIITATLESEPTLPHPLFHLDSLLIFVRFSPLDFFLPMSRPSRPSILVVLDSLTGLPAPGTK